MHKITSPVDVVIDAIDALGEQHRHKGQTTVEVQIGHERIAADTVFDETKARRGWAGACGQR